MDELTPAPSLPLPPLLLVEDDARFRERLAKALRARGLEVLEADGHEAALTVARTHDIGRALVDLRMPGKNGLAVVRDLLALRPEVEVIVLTGYGSIATAVEAVRLGARDYLTKPMDADRILAAFGTDPTDKTSPADQELSFTPPSMARLEREHIERVLRECNGNISKTARVLGIHRRTLQYKLAKYPAPR